MGMFDSNDQGDPPRRGIGGRVIGFILVLVVGFFMYLSQVQENPVTGEKQHISLTPEAEIRLGLQSAPEMARQMGGELPASDPRSLEVKKMGELIVSQTDAHKGPWKFQFHVLADTKTINAFALPGGQVFITAGLINKLQTEAQLAGVLSHEMGHVIERHSAQQMAKGQLGQILVTAVGVGASDPQNPSGSYGATVIASVVNNMFQLRYSRKDESEADLWGLKLMSQVGFDPRAMIEVMEILKAASSAGYTPEIFQTHPNPDLRIQRIKAALEANPPAADVKQGRKLNAIFKGESKE